MVAAIEARFALGDGAFAATIERAERAIAIGRQLDDLDVELLGMNYVAMGLSRQRRDRPRRSPSTKRRGTRLGGHGPSLDRGHRLLRDRVELPQLR